jgi:hypothetical protein
MQTSPETLAMLGVFTLGGGEIILVLAIVLIFFISRWLWDRSDNNARDAGRTVGGIYGKRAAQAITPDNKVAELYNPAVFRKRPKWRRPRKSFLLELWQWIRARVGWK